MATAQNAAANQPSSDADNLAARLENILRGIRAEHPDWTTDHINAEAEKRLSGTTPAEAVWYKAPAFMTGAKILGGAVAIIGSAFAGYKVGERRGVLKGLDIAADGAATMTRVDYDTTDLQAGAQASKETGSVTPMRRAA